VSAAVGAGHRETAECRKQKEVKWTESNTAMKRGGKEDTKNQTGEARECTEREE
jgi:hypothetical protein